MPNISDLVKKANYDAKISEMGNKYFTTSDYDKFTSNTLDAKITQKKLVNESDLNEKIKTLATKEEIKTLATKGELKAEQDKIVKLQKYDLSIFIFIDGAQLYLIFHHFKKLLQLFMVPHTQSQNGNLRDCQMKNLHLLIQHIKVFLQN